MVRLDAEAQAAVRPAPDDWAPAVMDRGVSLAWEGAVTIDGQTIALEVGLRPRTPEERTAALEELRRTSWTLTELARLGRADMLTPFRKDRHDPRRRPVSVPTGA